MTRTLSILLLSLLPAVASAGGGGAGGITIEGQYIPRYGPSYSPHEAPGNMLCVGLVGFGVGNKGMRIGGDGQYCRARPGVDLIEGGMQLGRLRRIGPLYITAYAGIGVGLFSDSTSSDGDYAAFYGYLKPSIALGVPIGPVAFEAGFYGKLPLNFVQVTEGVSGRGIITPTIGGRVSLLFGTLSKVGKRTASDDAPKDVEAPLAVPAALPPPVAEVPPSSEEGEGERPLAIPEDDQPAPLE